MLASKPLFFGSLLLSLISFDTRFIFIVKTSLKKWNKIKPKNRFLFFCCCVKSGAVFYETEVSKQQPILALQNSNFESYQNNFVSLMLYLQQKRGHINKTTTNKQDQTLIAKAKPFIDVLFLQVTHAIMNIITKTAMDDGLSNYVFVVYRHTIAFIVITPFALYFESYFSLPLSLKQYEKIN